VELGRKTAGVTKRAVSVPKGGRGCYGATDNAANDEREELQCKEQQKERLYTSPTKAREHQIQVITYTHTHTHIERVIMMKKGKGFQITQFQVTIATESLELLCCIKV
jgi:hypothetical protein